MRFERCLTLLIVILCCLLQALCSENLENWPSPSERIERAIRTQRDVSKPIPIDQLTTFGVSLNTLLFENQGYTSNTLDDVERLLSVGVQSVMIDLYWNEFTQKWQLCPAPIPNNSTSDISATVDVSWKNRTYRCQPAFTVDTLMEKISMFLSSTNSNLNVNLIQLLFKLKSISDYEDSKFNSTRIIESIYKSSNAKFKQLGNSTLNDTINAFGSVLFTPIDLSNYRTSHSSNYAPTDFYNNSVNAFPTLERFLLFDYKRILVIIDSDELVESDKTYQFTQQDKDILFFRNQSINSVMSPTTNTTLNNECSELISNFNNNDNHLEVFNNISLTSHFRFVIDSSNSPFTNSTFKDYVRCGYSPILNSSLYQIANDTNDISLGETINNFLPLSFWSWAIDQPSEPFEALNETDRRDNDSNSLDDQSQVAYKCAVLSTDGWKIANCYHKYPYACKNTTSPNDWTIIHEDTRQYFDAYKDSCPKGFAFGLPRSSVEMLALMDTVNRKKIPYPIWIDLNDITVSGCYVTGGPYAECPYQRTVTSSTLIRLTAPSFVIALFILFLIFLEKFIRINPIQTNRKRHWKRIINEYNEKQDYEGVPS